MGRKQKINWENATAEELAIAKVCGPTQEGFVRFQALELLLAGYSQEEVSRISNRDGRTIRRWIEGFNDRGIDGVVLKGRSGRPRRIEAAKF